MWLLFESVSLTARQQKVQGITLMQASNAVTCLAILYS